MSEIVAIAVLALMFIGLQHFAGWPSAAGWAFGCITADLYRLRRL